MHVNRLQHCFVTRSRSDVHDVVVAQAYEFVDTAIMILKKNTRQISFLHGDFAPRASESFALPAPSACCDMASATDGGTADANAVYHHMSTFFPHVVQSFCVLVLSDRFCHCIVLSLCVQSCVSASSSLKQSLRFCCSVWYSVIRFGPGGEAWFCCALNSAIHVLMWVSFLE